VNQRSGADALYVIATSGKTIAASNWNTSQSFVGQDYANRPYFIDARAGGNGQFYGIGITTGIAGFFMAAPVRRNGLVTGVVAVKISLREIEAAWGMARDPVMLSDARGVFFIGSVAPWKFTTRRPLAAGDLRQIGLTQQYGKRPGFPMVPWQVQTESGQPGYLVQAEVAGQARKYLAVDEALAEFGWTLTVMADHAPVARARNLTWTIGALAAALLALGGLVARQRARRLADQAAAQQEREQLQRQRLVEQGNARLELELRVRDMAGRILYVNPALCAMTGYRADELLDRLAPYPYWHPDDLDKHWEESRSALEGREAQAQRAGAILRQIRGPLQPQTEDAGELVVNDLITDALALLKLQVRAQPARIDTDLQPGLPLVRGDRTLLEQVLLNLLLNGLQAMRDTPVAQRRLEIDTALVDGFVQVRVSDHGPGIGPELAARLFESFFTTKPDGFGLGLSICHTIIEGHRGRLSFANRHAGRARWKPTAPMVTASLAFRTPPRSTTSSATTGCRSTSVGHQCKGPHGGPLLTGRAGASSACLRQRTLRALRTLGARREVGIEVQDVRVHPGLAAPGGHHQGRFSALQYGVHQGLAGGAFTAGRHRWQAPVVTREHQAHELARAHGADDRQQVGGARCTVGGGAMAGCAFVLKNAPARVDRARRLRHPLDFPGWPGVLHLHRAACHDHGCRQHCQEPLQAPWRNQANRLIRQTRKAHRRSPCHCRASYRQPAPQPGCLDPALRCARWQAACALVLSEISPAHKHAGRPGCAAAAPPCPQVSRLQHIARTLRICNRSALRAR
jgi:C4-dicarboxylate-specific signal transduction histidine kinase